MRKYWLLLPFIFLFVSVNSQSTDRLSSVDHYSYSALYFLPKTKAFITAYLNISIDEPTPYDRLDELGVINKEDFLRELNRMLEELPKQDCDAIIDSVMIWDKMATLIDFPFYLDDTNLSEFHELIVNIDSTEHLVNKYIVMEGQYWGSLSTSQTPEVYYNLMNYLLHSNSENKLRFFKRYFELAYEVGKKD